MKLAAWPGRRPRLTGLNLADALEHEFGNEWGESLPMRLLEAVWDGDLRAIDSDARRFHKILPTVAPPVLHLRVQVEFLTALYTSAARWSRIGPGADPQSDELRYGEVAALINQRSTILRRAAGVAESSTDPLSGSWVATAADLVVRAVRFRDGFALPCLVRALTAADLLRPKHHDAYERLEEYLGQLAQWGARVVDGVPDGARNGEDCMRRIKARFGGEHPYAAAVRTVLLAIRDGDGDALREMADLTAAAKDDERSPARVLHNLVLAGEKVLHGKA